MRAPSELLPRRPNWSPIRPLRGRDSNPRPSGYEPDSLSRLDYVELGFKRFSRDRATWRSAGICGASCPISCPSGGRRYTWVYWLHGKGHGLPSRRSPRRGGRRGAARRNDSQRGYAGVRRRGAAPTPRGPSGGNAIAAQRRLAPWRRRRGTGEGDAARSVTALLLDASVLLAAFDPEDDHHRPARDLLEDDEATLATLDLAR